MRGQNAGDGLLGAFSAHLGRLKSMAEKVEEIRAAAHSVASSHGLDVVDLEFIGPAKERTLRIYLEKNAEGRAKLRVAIAAGDVNLDMPESLIEGTLNSDQLS